jgi:GT2 family glycosyltransferase
MHCSWGIVLNPDVSIPSSVRLREWIQAAESDGVVVSGPQILDKNGKVTQPLMVLSPWNAVLRSSTPILGHIHATTGCAIAIQLKPFFSWGGFDERLFLYREEQALGHTLEQHGLNWGYHPTFCVVHDHQRKVSSYSNWLKHRIWEYQSTLHIFSSYQKRTILDLCWYRVLFGIKSTIYALLLPLIARK